MATVKRTIRFRYQGELGRAELLDDGRLRVLDGPAAERFAPRRGDAERALSDLHSVELLAPVVPSKIIGIGLNYRAHAAEMKKPLPSEPLMFLKAPSALLDPGRPIVRPAGYDRVDFEGELAVVIGRPARRVRASEALEYVAGYCCLNDVTVRDLQTKDVQYTRAKGFDTFCPLGPCLAAGLDPSSLKIETRVDGQVRQSSSTSDLIFPVPELIAAVSRVMTLLPGDVIATGTPPGVGQIEPGAVVEIAIEGIGVLRNPIVAENQTEEPLSSSPAQE